MPTASNIKPDQLPHTNHDFAPSVLSNGQIRILAL